MATDLDQESQPRRRGADFAQRRSALLRSNLGLSRYFLARRRRDLRFRMLPYDALQTVNALAVFATLTAILIVLFDPLLGAWQQSLSGRVVRFFAYVTRLGKSDWILLGSGIFVIAMLLLDATALRPRHRAQRTLRSLAAFYVFASVAIAGIIANVGKYAIGRARPKFFPETGSVSFDFFSGDASWASFPSGHATTAMALAVALAMLFPRLRWIFICIGFWIAASRLFLLQHYPSDMFAGCLLGFITAWLIARALAQRRLLFGFDSDGRLVRRKGASGRLFH